MSCFFSEKCPNLLRYFKTMKSEYWPDWNENIREKPSE